ncbi:hypothetical protein ACRE_051150 [Hapsidospora chrysogenum ATCC 11550]|uniref:DUF4874 domain-containing protein n=1 Tax=Hapsidospora chrysogenum (strain ATCC 11550 / CBS 779.69 / DSM 880 / IAM 14645 / JCM 23072 / IMI 49137) TaxID=857340 RepID=A0A086T424_HAPC1|nr:hypothetical protein ACRE_051150 [Hapsidospora chrysogenum ATCC 11550]
MSIARLLLVAAAANAATIGFASYREIIAGADNSHAITYTELDRSSTLFLNIQIVAGEDNAAVIDDFRTLCENYGAQNVSVIPRVRYGSPDGSMALEPEDSSQVLTDVATWADVFAGVKGTIDIPVLQAGFLGAWAEWHSGPLCDDTETRRAVVEGLQSSGAKVAVRTPMAHKELFPGDRAVTIHNDCIFDGGPQGSDGGTFPEDDRQAWVDYTREVSKGNTYGGEPCSLGGGSSYDWSDFEHVCGPGGLKAYIEYFGISYLNPGNPPEFFELFNDPTYADCVEEIQDALLSYQ